ncbi:MAG TPA: bifunctional transaldolase/phosoglucose isomerase [Methylomirabilota bacterium]|nr:bifunctional transaldolase/phosoglucose isomerase [Methylomirabilota bacterium]
MPNALKELLRYRQSVWLDYIRRSLITGGELRRLLDEDGLRGVTSNPAIFEKAIAGSADYESQLKELARRRDLDAKGAYEVLAVRDIQDVADILKPIYEQSGRRDGYVSLEVSPDLANDTRGTLDEARRLWATVARANVMIKVPATPAGVPAIRELIGDGINVNVTLLFALEAYEAVAEAYIAGLEALAARGGDPSRVESVASFFISRIDSLVDSLVEARLKASDNALEQGLLKGLPGRVAIANAKLTYQRYKEIYRGPRWAALAARGARTQRLLWASTSTKNASYRDVIYVEELIGPDTVNTIPPATYDAFRDHGRLRASLEDDLEDAHHTMDSLAESGISMKQVTDQLLVEGVKVFVDAFAKLMGAVQKRLATPGEEVTRQAWTLPADLTADVKTSLKDWADGGKVHRLWARDASLWTGADEGRRLGWLGITDDQLAQIDHLRQVAEDVRRGGFTHAVLLGMGGTVLGAEALARTFGRIAGSPELHVLDSTDPAQIRAVERALDPARTLFIVASKSGSTLEPNILMRHFLERVRGAVGPAEAGRRFMAITDPGSKMQHVAEAGGFRMIFLGEPSIGGRFSTLSDFGAVPAAVMGLDVARLLGRAEEMAHACAASVPVEENPGVVLGTIMGVLGRRGRDKVTLIVSPAVQALGTWIEQLLTASLGKAGRGLLAVEGETAGVPDVYGADRLFVYLRSPAAPDAGQDAAVAALQTAGQPVVRITIDDAYDLGAEFFRWQFATAVAGSVLGLNPFDQPDIEGGKVAARKLAAAYEKTGALAPETPIRQGDGLTLFADAGNAAALDAASRERTVAAALKAHLGRVKAGDYVALLPYLEMSAANETDLGALRLVLRDRLKVATSLGFGPRYLHSSGQAYKGGRDSGVFMQITADDAADLPVPGHKYTFGVVKAAQARGDLEMLAERGRRAIRVHVGRDVKAGLAALRRAVEQALG